MAITSQIDSSITFPLSADINSASFDILQYLNASIQHTWTGGTGTGGSAQVQASNDGANWAAYGTPVTISTASGSSNQDLGGASSASEFNFRYIRVAYTHGSVTTGTYTAWICLKKNP